jgi:hypothetical protein
VSQADRSLPRIRGAGTAEVLAPDRVRADDPDSPRPEHHVDPAVGPAPRVARSLRTSRRRSRPRAARAVRRRSDSRRASDCRGGGPLPGLLQAPRHRRDPGAAGRARRAGRRARTDRRHVRRRADQHHRGPGRAARRAAGPRDAVIEVDGVDVVPACTRCSTDGARSPRPCGRALARAHRRAHRHVVNIGIGGSDLGPAMAYRGAADPRHGTIECRFVSNVDGADLDWARRDLDPATTLFVVARRPSPPLETLTNARRAPAVAGRAPRRRRRGGAHFVAVSTNAARWSSSGSTRPTCSASGTGSAAATR